MVHTRETRASASEIKFVIDPAMAPAIRAWAREHLKADPHGAGPFGDEYETASLYFDTPALDVFHRRGSYGRAKYRVRRYGTSDVVFLERKLRKPGILIKRRTIASIGSLPLLQSPEVQIGWDGEWFHRRLQLRKLEPSCQVSYHRMARVLACPDGIARLTLDSDLKAAAIESASFTTGGARFLQHGRAPRAREGAARGAGAPRATEPGCGAEPHVSLILELKYHRYLPALFRRLVEEFALEIGTASKYRLAMAALGHVPSSAAASGPVHA